MKQFSRAFNLGFACSLAVGAMAGQSAFGSVVDLGAASGFSVLATDGGVQTSDSAFQGSIGVAAAGFNYSQSGGGETGLQIPVTAYIHTGSTGSGPSPVTIQQGITPTGFDTDKFLAQAVSDATKASNTLAGLTATQPMLGNININSNTTILSESTVGNYVLSISSITTNQGAILLNAPAGSTVVLNISGGINMNGGSSGNGILDEGGLTASNVIINILGSGNQVVTTGGGNSQDIQASILDLGGSVNLHPGEVDGTIVAQSFTSSSGSLVKPPLTPVPEANAVFVLAALFPLMLLVTPARMRKVIAAFRAGGAVGAMA